MALTIADSDILIDVAHGDAEAIGCLLRLEKTSILAISAVSQMELIVGCRNKTELNSLEKFLNRYQTLKITDQISDRAVDLLKQYFLSHGLLIADIDVGRAKRMDEQEKTPNLSYEIRVTPGRAGSDPNAPDWEVLELENGVVQDYADVYNNLTLAEANQIAGMWIKKKEEAETVD